MFTPDMTREELEALTGIAMPGRARLVPANELVAKAGPPDFLVDGLMERDSFGVLFGKWGSGKSLVAIDWSVRIALGMAIQGRKVETGPVVYVAGEGHGGLGRRLAAWQSHHGEAVNDQLVFTSAPVPIADESQAMALNKEIVTLAETWGREPALIVIDTLARNFGPGDENSNADMGAHVMMVDRWLRVPFGACVLELHHPGHAEAERGRGASALPAACDFEYRLEATSGALTLRVTKTKDFEPPPPLSYRIVEEAIGLNGHSFKGPVVAEEGEIAPEDDAEEPATDHQRDAIKALEGLYQEHQEHLDNAGIVGTARVKLADWRAEMDRQGIIGGRHSRQEFYRLRHRLEARKLIEIDAGYVYLKAEKGV